MTKELREIIELIQSKGLSCLPSPSGHYKVRTADGAYLFTLPGTPSDPQWRWNVLRDLRRLGILGKPDKRRKNRKSVDIDTTALKIAQEQAELHGEHIPSLSDLENPTEFFSRIKKEAFPHLELEKHRLLNMGVDAEKSYFDFMQTLGYDEEKKQVPQHNSTRVRLEQFIEERGQELTDAVQNAQRSVGEKVTVASPIVEFARVGFEIVGPSKNLKNWKSQSSAQQAVYVFLKGTNVSLWAINLIEATLDYYQATPTVEYPTVDIEPPTVESSELAPTFKKIAEVGFMETSRAHTVREQYTSILLIALRTQAENSMELDESILSRLDKLVGLE